MTASSALATAAVVAVIMSVTIVATGIEDFDVRHDDDARGWFAERQEIGRR